MDSIGIIGAGKVGIVLAQLATKAGYKVYIAGSGSKEKIALTISVLVPGAIAATSAEVAEKANNIILAIPLGRYKELPIDKLKGKLVIDTMNYWWEIDGERPEFTNPTISTTELVQQFLSESRVVKAFSHVGYHDLDSSARPKGAKGRKAIAIAGNNKEDLQTVSELVNTIGFDPYIVGNLASGIVLQPGGPIFGAHMDASALHQILVRK